MAIFNSYVSLPEGIENDRHLLLKHSCQIPNLLWIQMKISPGWWKIQAPRPPKKWFHLLRIDGPSLISSPDSQPIAWRPSDCFFSGAVWFARTAGRVHTRTANGSSLCPVHRCFLTRSMSKLDDGLWWFVMVNDGLWWLMRVYDGLWI